MGGLVTRSAFTCMSGAGSESARRAGFSSIDVTTLDTPLAGAPEGMPDFIAQLSDMQTYRDMGAGSDFFRDLRTMPLPGGVSFEHIPAVQGAGTHDPHLWLEDLSPDELAFVGSGLSRMDIEG